MTDDKVTPIRPNIKQLPPIRHFDFVVVPDKAEVTPIREDLSPSEEHVSEEKSAPTNSSPDDAEAEKTDDHGVHPMLW